MDYCDEEHEELKRLIQALNAGELEIWLLRNGERLPVTEAEQVIRHLIHLDFQLARAKGPVAMSAIDGDIADFIDAMDFTAHGLRTDNLPTYLLNEGHVEPDVAAAIRAWQQSRFRRTDLSWETFQLTVAGAAAVQELRARLG